MGGIGGCIDFENGARALTEVGPRMARALAPRGPDEGGSYVDDHALLVHRRLIVRDAAGGLQPMHAPDGNTILIYNGELYNAEDIRVLLIAKGHRFRGHADTEVLLHAYLEWGTQAFARLNGTFAFALWDKAAQKLVLCRDRLGVKPLFYSRRPEGLVFGSEIKTVLCHPGVRPRVGADGLRSILLLGPARPPGFGVFQDIDELLPAHYAVLTRDSFTLHPYWRLEAAEHTHTLEETIAHTRMLIEDAATRQMVSDIPLCTFLSGGLDSSILSMLAARNLGKENKQLHTWSVDFKDNDKYFTQNAFQPSSDADYIRPMADAIGAVHHEVILENPSLCAALLPAVDARDLPGMADVDSSLLLFGAQVKKAFSVCQSGECADELFGGYPWYHREEILFEDTFPWSRSVDFRLGLLQDGVVTHGEEFVRQHYLDTCAAADKLPGESPKDARMREMFMLSLNWFMATLLERKDRMSMYCGLEARVPFCDHRIVEYAYNMPWAMKALDGREKGILRKAFADDLPEEIVWRKKSPFPKTFSPEYTQLTSSYVRQIMQDDRSFVPALFRESAIEALILEPDAMTEPFFGQLMRGPQVFAYLIQLDRWLKKYHVELC